MLPLYLTSTHVSQMSPSSKSPHRAWIWSSAVLLLVGALAWSWWARARFSAQKNQVAEPEPSEKRASYGTGSTAPSVVFRQAGALEDAGESAPLLSSAGTLYAQFGWGSGERALARERPAEANPEAPMSFVSTQEGVIILDQLNGRVVRLDKNGKFVREDKLSVQAAQEIALGPHGELLAMDRLVSKEVEILDKAGRSLGTLPLEGKGIDNGGATTGLFVSGDKVYAETSHSVLVELGSIDGKPSVERPTLSGRPSRDGSLLLSAGRNDSDSARLWVNAFSLQSKRMKWARDVGVGAPIRQILLLESDARGVVYVAMETAADDEHVGTHFMCLSPDDGHVLGRVRVPTNTMPEETFRDFSVRDDGTVIYVHRTEDGSQYLQYHCP